MLQDLFSDYKLRIMKVGFGFIIVITLGYRPDVYIYARPNTWKAAKVYTVWGKKTVIIISILFMAQWPMSCVYIIALNSYL